eukprot:scaffold36079_cov112-Isochrysis_galbana.AAC.3
MAISLTHDPHLSLIAFPEQCVVHTAHLPAVDPRHTVTPLALPRTPRVANAPIWVRLVRSA